MSAGLLVLSAVIAKDAAYLRLGSGGSKWCARSVCRMPGSDLTLAAHPGGTHSVVLKISDVFIPLAALRRLCLPETRIRAPHRMQRHCEFPRQRDRCLPWPRPLSDRLGPGTQVGNLEVSTEDRVRIFKQALAGEHVAARQHSL
jgi:hypothetical protein